MKEKIDLSRLSFEEKARLVKELLEEQKRDASARRDAYEALRMDFIFRIKQKFYMYVEETKEFKKWLRSEAESWYEIMKEYGKLKRDDQMGFTLSDDDFSFQVKGNKVKKFDERADIAEKRLVDFLTQWVETSEKGTKDPMYKLAMMMIQRNEDGDLDYKSISRLYELEEDFNSSEYSEIMSMFRESNVVEATAIHFYFEEKNKYNIWNKVEPSFNRL
jgi:hypothetical protein